MICLLKAGLGRAVRSHRQAVLPVILEASTAGIAGSLKLIGALRMSETQSAVADGQQLTNTAGETGITNPVGAVDASLGNAAPTGMSAPSRGFVERLVDGKPVWFR